MTSARALLMGLLVAFTFASVPINFVQGCSINVVNNCPYGVTACAQGGSDPISQYLMVPGGTQLLDFGGSCQWLAGAVWASVTGQCANPVGTNAATDRNLANLAEFTIGPGSGVDTYDLSNVNAYTIGLSISISSVVGGDGSPTSCKPSISCVIDDISSFCQGDNQLMTQPSSALSCVNSDGPNAPSPTSNTELFKAACPDAYSYVHDDPTSTFTCGTGSDYQVTFCP